MAVEQFDKTAKETQKVAKKASCLTGIFTGFFLCFMFGFFTYAYAMAGILIINDVKNPSTGETFKIYEIVAVSQACLMSMMTFAGVVPIIPAIVKALVVGREIFDVIERDPQIKDAPNAVDFTSDESIQFKDIKFRYPTQVEKTPDIF